MTRTEDEILSEAEAYSAALDRREERREIYQMVAQAILTSDFKEALRCRKDFEMLVPEYAEAIYQGMIRFVGDK